MTLITTTSVLYHVRLRRDMPRDVARAYWAGGHADIVRRLPHISEYRQHHFSPTDHGYWPATPGVGTDTAQDRLDGLAEMTFTSVLGGLLVGPRARPVFLDEQNAFAWDVGHLAGPYGGRRSTESHADVSHRTTLLIRRRAGVPRRRFATYVHDGLAGALRSAGAQDLRSYVFRSRLPHPTPGVTHNYPAHERFSAAIHLGADSRANVAELIAHPSVAAAINDQAAYCTAMHAYTTELLVPVITGAQP